MAGWTNDQLECARFEKSEKELNDTHISDLLGWVLDQKAEQKRVKHPHTSVNLPYAIKMVMS